MSRLPPTAILVQDLLESAAARLPDKVALICGDRRLTYADIDERADRLANALQNHGVRRGDRVVLCLKNSVEAVVGIFATLKAGGTFVPVNRTTKGDKLAYILNNCRATALFCDAGDADHPLGSRLLRDVPSLKFLVVCGPAAASRAGAGPSLDFEGLIGGVPSSRPARTNIDLDLACLIYTSGSTGEPKGVMSDHSNVLFAASSIIEYLHTLESDVILDVLPLSFDYGLYQLLMAFKCGATLVLAESFAYPAAVLKLLEQEHVTGFPGVPTIFALLLQMDLSPYDLSQLRYLTNTAAALPPAHILELRRKFHWATLYSMYGLTETKRTLYLPPEQLEKRAGSVGIPIPGTECWVEDETGRRCGPGEVGELVVRGRHVMRGYWESPEATARRFRPGPVPGERLCHTGDLFTQDGDGFFYFVGRSDDIIKSRGEKVAPKEVEAVLHGFQGVAEAAVVGVPDAILGQAIKAIIVPARGASLTAAPILAYCRAHLESHMVPQQIEFRDELPRTSSGKIARRELR
jgi:amino acid adenylation domain-containing protein